MEGFVKLRRGLFEHLRAGKLSSIEFEVLVFLLNAANYETGVAETCALTLAYDRGNHRREKQYQAALARLKEKLYINYPRGKGLRGAYPVLIHKFEPTVGRWFGYRLNAWKHGEDCLPEYERVGGELADAGGSPGAEAALSGSNKEVRSKKEEKPEAVLNLERRIQLRERHPLTDEELKSFTPDQVLDWADERAAELRASCAKNPRLLDGLGPEVERLERIARENAQGRSTQDLEMFKKTRALTAARCPQPVLDELERRKSETTVGRIEASDSRRIRKRKSRPVDVLEFFGLRVAYDLYERRLLRAAPSDAARRAVRLRWASSNVGRPVVSFSDLTLREAKLLWDVLRGVRADAGAARKSKTKRHKLSRATPLGNQPASKWIQ